MLGCFEIIPFYLDIVMLAKVIFFLCQVLVSYLDVDNDSVIWLQDFSRDIKDGIFILGAGIFQVIGAHLHFNKHLL